MRQLAKLWGKGQKREKVIHYYLYGCLVGDVQRQHRTQPVLSDQQTLIGTSAPDLHAHYLHKSSTKQKLTSLMEIIKEIKA
jgi:hypothetical protein